MPPFSFVWVVEHHLTHLSDGWSTAWHSLSHRLLMWSSFSLRVRASFLLDCWITSPPSAFMLFKMFWWLLIPELKSYNIISVINDHLLDPRTLILQHSISYKHSFTESQNSNPTTWYQLLTIIHWIPVINNHHGPDNKQTPKIIRNIRKKQSPNETWLHVMATL